MTCLYAHTHTHTEEDSEANDSKPTQKPQQLEPVLRPTKQKKRKQSTSQQQPQSDADSVEHKQEQDGKLKKSIYELDDMKAAIKKGICLLYLVSYPANSEEKEATFFCLGVVDKEPLYKEVVEDNDVLAELWVHTADLKCSEDAHWPQSLQDGYFHAKTTSKDNWTDIWSSTVVVLGILGESDFTDYKCLRKQARKRAENILEYYEESYAYVKAFVNQNVAQRVTSKRKIGQVKGK